MTHTTHNPVHYITIDEDYAGQRIDNFLFTRFKNLPKTRIYRMLRKGEFRVNKKRIDAPYRLQSGDILRIPPMHLSETPKAVPGARSLAILTGRVIYEDNKLMIINKPAGIPVHGGTGVHVGVIETLRALYPLLPHLELVHRLDKDTSGCLIIAKKRSILKELHGLLRTGAMIKRYLTLTRGRWKDSDLRVDVPLLKNTLASGERIVKVNAEGKTALTEFSPKHLYAHASLMDVRLYTGRTHQIRVHARYKQHPVAGDEKYGDKDFNKQMKDLGLKRMFLHAHALEFTLPSTGEVIRASAPLDKDLKMLLGALLT